MPPGMGHRPPAPPGPPAPAPPRAAEVPPGPQRVHHEPQGPRRPPGVAQVLEGSQAAAARRRASGRSRVRSARSAWANASSHRSPRAAPPPRPPRAAPARTQVSVSVARWPAPARATARPHAQVAATPNSATASSRASQSPPSTITAQRRQYQHPSVPARRRPTSRAAASPHRPASRHHPQGGPDVGLLPGPAGPATRVGRRRGADQRPPPLVPNMPPRGGAPSRPLLRRPPAARGRTPAPCPASGSGRQSRRPTAPRPPPAPGCGRPARPVRPGRASEPALSASGPGAVEGCGKGTSSAGPLRLPGRRGVKRSRRRCPAPGEHRQPPQERPLRHRRAGRSSSRSWPQRLLARRQVRPPVSRRSVVPARRQQRAAPGRHPRGRQLEGQGNPVQPAANLDQRQRVLSGQGEPGPGRAPGRRRGAPLS